MNSNSNSFKPRMNNNKPRFNEYKPNAFPSYKPAYPPRNNSFKPSYPPRNNSYKPREFPPRNNSFKPRNNSFKPRNNPLPQVRKNNIGMPILSNINNAANILVNNIVPNAKPASTWKWKMIGIVVIIVLALLGYLGYVYLSGDGGLSFKDNNSVSLSFEQATSLIDNNPKQFDTIIDLRSDDDFENGNIPGSINIPFDKLSIETDIMNFTDAILLYDSDGSLSKKGFELMKKKGFKNVRFVNTSFSSPKLKTTSTSNNSLFKY